MKNQQQSNVSEVQLTYKNKVKASDRMKITCSRDAYKIFMDNWNPEIIEFVEEFKILLMNRSNSVLGILEISKGGISGTVTDVRVIFQAAIKGNASGIICAHNRLPLGLIFSAHYRDFQRTSKSLAARHRDSPRCCQTHAFLQTLTPRTDL